MGKERNNRAITVNKFVATTAPRSMNSYREERSVIFHPGPPGSGLAYPRAGTAPRFRLSGLPFWKGALTERGGRCVTGTGTAVKSIVFVKATNLERSG
jgi:hypothetical protein